MAPAALVSYSLFWQRRDNDHLFTCIQICVIMANLQLVRHMERYSYVPSPGAQQPLSGSLADTNTYIIFTFDPYYTAL